MGSHSASVLFHAFAQMCDQAREIGRYRLFKNLPVQPGDILRDREPVLRVRRMGRESTAGTFGIMAGQRRPRPRGFNLTVRWRPSTATT